MFHRRKKSILLNKSSGETSKLKEEERETESETCPTEKRMMMNKICINFVLMCSCRFVNVCLYKLRKIYSGGKRVG